MTFKCEGIVLRARRFSEADRLYDIFTSSEGVISAVLRSAAKPGNKLAGHLLPFSRVRLMIGRGKKDHVAGVVTVQDYKNIRDNLKNITLASSVVELFLNGQSHGDKRAEYHLLESILNFINDEDIPQEKKLIVVRIFLWKYLSIAGWQPQLDKCMICSKKIDISDTVKIAGKYVQGRGIICLDHNSSAGTMISGEMINFLNKIIKADWLELLDLEISKEINKDWLKISQEFYQAVYERPSQALKLFIYG